MHRGIATFSLDYGRCPAWLFERMRKLAQKMIWVIVAEYGPEEFVKRIADPIWFQSLGTVLAFDWNSSGLTTILTAALKEAIQNQEKDLGVFICGGKGRTSRKTPDEIEFWAEKINLDQKKTQVLIYNSKMSAKVDNSLIQDGFQIYHHAFFFTKKGAWTVVQQGMNTFNQTARRYHWFSENIKDLVCEPHSGIVSDVKNPSLNLVARESARTRELSTELVSSGNYYSLSKEIELLRKYSSKIHRMIAFRKKEGLTSDSWVFLSLANQEFKHHPVELENFFKSQYLEKIFRKLCQEKPENYENLLAIQGVGPKTIRALALISEIIYGAKPSYQDPARYSFAHGGKDGTPYPVDRKTYDQTIETMKKIVFKTKIDFFEKKKILNKLQ